MLMQDKELKLNFTFVVGFNASISPELHTAECWGNDDPKIFDLDALNIHLSRLITNGQPLPSGVEKVSTSTVLDDINNETLDCAAKYYLLHSDNQMNQGVAVFELEYRTLKLPDNLYIPDDEVKGNTVLDLERTQSYLSALYRTESPLPMGVTLWWLDDAYREINEGIFNTENFLIPVIN